MKTPLWIHKIRTPRISKIQIPIYSPYITGNEKKYVDECFSQGWFSSKGKFVTRFEKEFAAYCKVEYAISCSSGTSALFLALKALGVKKGDEVIVPTFTMISTAFAVSYLSAVPVFVDCQKDNGNIDISKIEMNITSKTKAIIPVDIYGNPAQLDTVQEIADKHNLRVVEDAAEAIGSEYVGKKIGNVSPISIFSLYINKVVTSGEGGMITTKSKDLYCKLKALNNYSFSPIRHFWHRHIGYNFRLSNLQAAIGVGQLEHISDILERKTKIAHWYRSRLKALGDKFCEISINNKSKSNYWKVAYRVTDDRYSVFDLRKKFAQKSIETRGFFIPLHLQPVYRKLKYIGKFPHSEKLAQSGILLPSGPDLEESEVDMICKIIRKFFGN